jgi:hypothetical protein
MTRLRGQVVAGCGMAAEHLPNEVLQLPGGPFHPGSLNLMLERPQRFSADTAIQLGEYRMFWPATLNGLPVWVYRWGGPTPLHIAEVVAPIGLRDEWGLSDGDTVELEVEPRHLDVTRWWSVVAWALVWLGRRNWFYRRDDYVARTRLWCKLLGANQQPASFPAALSRRIHGRAWFQRVIALADERDMGARARFKRIEAVSPEDQVRNLLQYTKASGASYAAQQCPAGYHTIELGSLTLSGQRDPQARLALVPVDLTGQSVLDLGSNQGGMLLGLASTVAAGVGVDYDARLVNCANRIRSVVGADNLCFYVFDLETEPLDLIRDFLPGGRVDVTFMLSVAMWIENWRDVVDFAASVSNALLFESNGGDEQQEEQLAHLRRRFREVTELAGSSEDDTYQKRRKLYWLSEPVP